MAKTYRLIKSADGWYDVDNMCLTPYGETIFNFYNYINTQRSTYEKEFQEILHKKHDYSKEFEKLDKKYPLYSNNTKLWDSVLEDIENYLLCDLHLPLNTNEHNNKREPSKEQNNFITKAIDAGWHNIPNNVNLSSIDILLLKEFKNLKIETIPCFIDNKWFTAYLFNDTNYSYYQFAMLDLQELRNHDNIDFAICEKCDQLFIKRGKQKRCNKCRKTYKKDYDRDKKYTIDGLHDKVRQYMKNTHKFSLEERTAFLEESGYYRKKIKLKNPIMPKTIKCRDDINTVQDYCSWVEAKHKEYKEIAKDRDAIYY